MLSATFIDLFFIPFFFVLIFRLFKGKQAVPDPGSPGDSSSSREGR
jgi:hypothetical protein